MNTTQTSVPVSEGAFRKALDILLESCGITPQVVRQRAEHYFGRKHLNNMPAAVEHFCQLAADTQIGREDFIFLVMVLFPEE